MKNKPRIDQYLAATVISLKAHQAAEYMLAEAAHSNPLHTVDTSPELKRNEKKYQKYIGELDYEGIVNRISKRFGDFHGYVVNEVLMHQWDCGKYPGCAKVLNEGLEWVADQRLDGGTDPLRSLRIATERAKGRTTCDTL